MLVRLLKNWNHFGQNTFFSQRQPITSQSKLDWPSLHFDPEWEHLHLSQEIRRRQVISDQSARELDFQVSLLSRQCLTTITFSCAAENAKMRCFSRFQGQFHWNIFRRRVKNNNLGSLLNCKSWDLVKRSEDGESSIRYLHSSVRSLWSCTLVLNGFKWLEQGIQVDSSTDHL